MLLQGTAIHGGGWVSVSARDVCAPITLGSQSQAASWTYWTESGSASNSACGRGSVVLLGLLLMASAGIVKVGDGVVVGLEPVTRGIRPRGVWCLWMAGRGMLRGRPGRGEANGPAVKGGVQKYYVSIACLRVCMQVWWAFNGGPAGYPTWKQGPGW